MPVDIDLNLDEAALRRAGGAFDALRERVEAARGAVEATTGSAGALAVTLDRDVGGAAETAARRTETLTDSVAGLSDRILGAFRGTLDRALAGNIRSFEDFGREFASALNRIAVDQVREDLRGLVGGAGGGSAGGIVDALFSDLFGFRHGGRFVVPGAGPPDSRLVAFRATPGEEVSVRPPVQSAAAPAVTVSMQVNTPDADSFRRSQGQILADLQRRLRRWDLRNN